MKKNNSNPFVTPVIKDSKLNTGYKKRIIDNVSYKKIDQDEFLNLSIPNFKINVFFILIMLIMSIMLGRVFYLQIYKGDYFRQVAEGNRIRVKTTKAPRGLIYDRNNKQLVKNVPNFVLTIVPGDLSVDKKIKNNIYENIASIIDLTKQEIKEKIDQKSLWQEIEIARNLSYEQAIQLIIASSNWQGVSCRPIATRQYNEADALAHVIGYVGEINEQELEKHKEEGYALDDYIGKLGLELYYEEVLRGEDGKKQVEINSRGEEIKTIAEQKPVAGDNLLLSLDMDLQKVGYEALGKYSEAKSNKGAALIALDPRDGEVLTLVSWPGFDTNKFVQGISQEDYEELLENEANPLFNKAISGEYPSGSTFKLITATAALDEGVINTSTTVESVGGIEINNWFFPDWKAGGHGTTNVTKALAESVNTFFYIAGGGTFNIKSNEIEGGLGIEKINKYAKAFGLGQVTNIDLVGEREGFLPTRSWKEEAKKEMWYIGDTYHVAIGQGDILTTPLQVANFTAAVANGGVLYKPHFIKDADVEIINTNFATSNSLAVVRQGMREAVTYGTAKRFQSLPINVAAKTGTAQHSGEGENHSWLTAFAPYENPEIVVTAIVEEGGEGTEAALPAVYEVLNSYFSN